MQQTNLMLTLFTKYLQDILYGYNETKQALKIIGVGDFMEVRISLQNLTDLSLFAGMSIEEIGEVLSKVNVIVKRFRKYDSIVLAGDSIENICILLNGTVQMIKEDIWGDKSIIANIDKGTVFAETFFGKSYDHSIVSFFASSESEILMLPFGKFLDNIGSSQANKKLICNFISIMADNNIKLIEKNEILSKKTLRAKILAYLEQEAKRTGSTKITVPFSRTDLANYLDADRSALTRELTRMQNEGLIAFERNTFEVLK